MAQVQTTPITENAAPTAALVAAPVAEQQAAAPGLQDQLKCSLTEQEAGSSTALQDDQEEVPATQTASAPLSPGSAMSQAMRVLKRLSPEATKEAFSNTIHSIVPSDTLSGHLALMRTKGVQVITDKGTCTIALSAGGGAVLLGSTGGALGVCGGMTSGALAGLVPALFTLGLSIPAGAAVGGGMGGLLGTAAGTMTGLIGGGAAGGVAYRYRVEIKNGALFVRVRVLDAKAKAAKAVQPLQIKATNAAETARTQARGTLKMISDKSSEVACRAQACTQAAATSAQTKASEFGAGAKSLALNPAVQVTSAAAAGGAVATGAGGGLLGLAAGGAAGATVGLVPALFTFGLSIPACALIGGGTGAFMGTAAGGTAGMVSGGAVGYGAYGAYTRRDEVKESACEAWKKISDVTESVKEKAKEKASISASFVKASLSGTNGKQ
mmetsp:Transcript_69305/g.136960  ORF Transcript_69305/g.136960 Transcript_69305/m.136960 type:complete len:439 (+) Transcript_69305:65-1381(+)|eukprot:CAMPEP_0172673158 /NCGR_PEP_ID=MMETSP1074-20121228/11978_1 /TAXON_ID=2916 /ORGANISM="Ceratium fusus, Strain PA161109" /LENGTH=438 /DNA_ID=CAMNT_0013490427 /DNA_START=64 /DNA_END=1380 /DNA_ORIENTATION=-